MKTLDSLISDFSKPILTEDISDRTQRVINIVKKHSVLAKNLQDAVAKLNTSDLPSTANQVKSVMTDFMNFFDQNFSVFIQKSSPETTPEVQQREATQVDQQAVNSVVDTEDQELDELPENEENETLDQEENSNIMDLSDPVAKPQPQKNSGDQLRDTIVTFLTPGGSSKITTDEFRQIASKNRLNSKLIRAIEENQSIIDLVNSGDEPIETLTAFLKDLEMVLSPENIDYLKSLVVVPEQEAAPEESEVEPAFIDAPENTVELFSEDDPFADIAMQWKSNSQEPADSNIR